MKPQEAGALPNDMVNPLPKSQLFNSLFNPLIPVTRFIDNTLTITGLEVRKLRHDPTELIAEVGLCSPSVSYGDPGDYRRKSVFECSHLAC